MSLLEGHGPGFGPFLPNFGSSGLFLPYFRGSGPEFVPFLGLFGGSGTEFVSFLGLFGGPGPGFGPFGTFSGILGPFTDSDSRYSIKIPKLRIPTRYEATMAKINIFYSDLPRQVRATFVILKMFIR